MNIKDEINRYNDTGMYYIINNVNNLDDLEKEWQNYSKLHKDLRRRSDEKSIEFFGKNNFDRYKEMKKSLMKYDDYDIEDIPLEESENIIQPEEEPHIRVELNYPYDSSIAAKKWSEETMRVIITPRYHLNELEKLWNDFLNQPKKLRRESDWKSLELFGLNNQDHYEALKNNILRVQDIKDANISESSTPCIEMSTFDYSCKDLDKLSGICRDIKLLEISTYNPKSISEFLKKDKILDSNIKEEDDFIDSKIPIILPSLTADEMIDIGVFNSDSVYNEFVPISLDENFTVNDWFEDYIGLCSGVISENTQKLSLLRYRKLNELCYQLSKDPENLELKQSILELGWNPEIPYTEENKNLAYKNTKRKLKEFYNEFQFIDISDIDDICYLNEVDDVKEDLHPVHFILFSSKALISKAIKKVTKSDYSHVAISLDSNMDNMFSFNMKGGGFVQEKLSNYPQDIKILVNTIFLKEEDHNKISEIINYYQEHQKETHYSIKNLFNILFNKVEESDMNMVCSQFVHKVLSLADINLIDKPNNLVVPEDFNKSGKKIYTIYKGKISNFKPFKINQKLKKLKASAQVFKEIFKITQRNERILEMYNVEAIGESKEFPVQFDNDGNLLIKNIKKINYEEEYAKSHKLLILYEKNNNLEGMKYELSKLWFMTNLLDKMRYNSKRTSRGEIKAINDAKAKIQNDFQKYMKIVLKEEKDFNFDKYYEESPFSDAVIKINASTLRFSKEFIKGMFM